MKVNVKEHKEVFTHEGGKAQQVSALEQLKRAVMCCLLWEDNFYESGVSIAERIAKLCDEVIPEDIYELTIKTRNEMHLRHVPLLLIVQLARVLSKKKSSKQYNVLGTIRKLIPQCIKRVDEMAELVALYWKDGKKPLPNGFKRGLADVFGSFSEYQLGKYNRDGKVKLRDVLFLCHPKANSKEQQEVWDRLAKNELAAPDTWEVALSGGANKKETFERLMAEQKLGALAFIRNLRNMLEAGVDKSQIGSYSTFVDASQVLPFRYLTAAAHAMNLEPMLEQMMFKCTAKLEKIPGKTIVIVDVSGSMYGQSISKYSELDRAKAACSLAVLLREMCVEPIIYATAGDDRSGIHATAQVPPRRGFALSDAIYNMCRPLGGGGIFLKQVIDYVRAEQKTTDQIIVITDEQDCDTSDEGAATEAKPFGKHNYMINVGQYENGVGYGNGWTHINGFSENIVRYIVEDMKQGGGNERN